MKISWLPGFEPPAPARAAYVPPEVKTKYPFKATINGEPVIVWPDWIEEDLSDDDPYDINDYEEDEP